MKSKVMIAEDDQVLSQVLSTRLRKAGFEVVVAFDAMQSFMVAVRMVPDIILLDINMPGGNGLDVLKKLKSSTKTCHIPVVVLSGSVEPSISDTVKELGAEEFLTKPPDFELLDATLGRILSPSALRTG
jgi:two-component system cell cycle response regulator